MNQVNYGIGQGRLPRVSLVRPWLCTDRSTSGRLTLRKLRLKKDALDKFRLPVDVVEGKISPLNLLSQNPR